MGKEKVDNPAKVVIKNCRLAFEKIFEAEAFSEGAPKKFSASFILSVDHPQVEAIKKAMVFVAKAKWKEDYKTEMKVLEKKDKLALHDGDLKAKYEGFAGNLYLGATNETAPRIRARNGKDTVEKSDGLIYGGCYVNGIVEFWAQDNQYGKRINATLMGVQYVGPGDAFTGGGAAEDDDFEELDDGVDDDFEDDDDDGL